MVNLSPSQCPGTNIFRSGAPWRGARRGESACKCHRPGEPRREEDNTAVTSEDELWEGSEDKFCPPSPPREKFSPSFPGSSYWEAAHHRAFPLLRTPLQREQAVKPEKLTKTAHFKKSVPGAAIKKHTCPSRAQDKSTETKGYPCT